MVWIAPMTAIADEPLTAAQFNNNIRDNMNETMVARAHSASLYFSVDTLNKLRANSVQNAFTNAATWTTSQEYTDPTITGPDFTFRCGGAVLVWVDSAFSHLPEFIGAKSLMSFEITRIPSPEIETTNVVVAPDDSRAVTYTKGTLSLLTDEFAKYSSVHFVEDLEPNQLYRIRAKYRTTTGVGVFTFPGMGILPL